MDYRINCDMWKSIFAVPSAIVDENIKLSGAAQLKVILWVLRHWGENFETEDISKALNMQTADVKDCMQYWCELGVMQAETQENTDENEKIEEKEEIPEKVAERQNKVVILKPQKPDRQHIAEMLENDGSIAYLMNFAEGAYGRLLSNNDKSTLIFIHEYYSMPIEVIVMLLQYVSGIGKCGTKYIEQLASEWWKKDIVTLERAEEYIQYMAESGTAVRKLLCIIGQSHRPPTDDELNTADMWFNKWDFSEEMVKEAYDLCVNNTGKFSYGYMKKVLEGWHEKGITNTDMARKEQNEYKKARSKTAGGYGATYDIDEYESINSADSEEWD